jgi:hypothetical protein
LTVKATDAAGNSSAVSTNLALVIDTSVAAPAAPDLSGDSDSGSSSSDNITNVTTPVFIGTVEANALVTLYDTDGTTVLGTATANGSGVYLITSSALAAGSHNVTIKAVDAAGNISSTSSALEVHIDTAAPTSIGASSTSVTNNAGLDAVVGQLNNNDTGVGGYVYTLIDGAGDTDNAGFSITAGALIFHDPALVGTRSIRVSVTDAAGNSFQQILTVHVETPPPPTPITTTQVDGVPVTSTTVPLPGGGIITQVTVPVITAGRNESSGNTSNADIPLVSSAGTDILSAQLPIGFGLTAMGGASAPAGNSLEELIRSIIAATPNHDSSDQGHLTANGGTFLERLPTTVPLLVSTIVPVTSNASAAGTLILSGTSTAQQHTALVIDTSDVAPRNSITLESVDFAAMVGAATVYGNTPGQILTGDVASQTFIVATASGSAIYSGGGNDRLQFGATASPAVADNKQSDTLPTATQSVLHGGTGGDAAVFAGKLSDYTLDTHDGHIVISLKAAPQQQAQVINVETLQFADQSITVENRTALTSITGLYHDVLGRQADVSGVDFWGRAEHAGTSLGQIALGIITSAEGQARHDAFNGDKAHDINLLYQAIFSRPAEAAGLAFWLDVMDHGVSLAQVADSFLHSPEMLSHNLAPINWDFS